MKQKVIYNDEMIQELRNHISHESFKYIYSPKFIFLCGKSFNNDYNTTNRGKIQQYINNRSNNHSIYFVLSESIWDDIFISDIDLLTFEEFLAELSDYIILFIESIGSACELGAFTFNDVLFADKLLIVLDKKYEHSNSFINSGPITKAKKNNSKIIYADLEKALLSEKELTNYIEEMIEKFNNKNVINKRIKNNNNNQVLINSFIIEILELLRILQPINTKDLIEVYKRVKHFSTFKFIKRDNTAFNSEIKVEYVFKLLQKAKIISNNNNTISLINFNQNYDFTFSFTSKSFNILRNKFLSRKFRYKEKGFYD